MSAAICPNGHASDESDYCSVCGAPITPAPTVVPPAPAPGAGECPACGTTRDAGGRFCEVCRYDFETGTPGPPPVVGGGERDPVPTTPASHSPPVPRPAGATARWEVTVTVDPSLDSEPDAATPPPAGAGERVFPVELSEMLIGRRDDARGIRPEIPVQDPAVSRRHAKLLLAEGGLAVLDLASANGTAVNGTEIQAGERHELNEGDTITMGRWSRLTIHKRT